MIYDLNANPYQGFDWGTTKYPFSHVIKSEGLNMTYNHIRVDERKIVIHVPGAGPEDISIEYVDQSLKVISTPSPESGGNYFSHSFTLPNLDINSTTATVKNGVLTIDLSYNKSLPNKIKVK